MHIFIRGLINRKEGEIWPPYQKKKKKSGALNIKKDIVYGVGLKIMGIVLSVPCLVNIKLHISNKP